MIQSSTTGSLFFTFNGTTELTKTVPSGSLVRVEILGSVSGGRTLVKIAGHIFSATGLKLFKDGEILNARIRFSGTTVYLHSVSPKMIQVSSTVFSRLGIEKTQVSSFLIAFFQKINARLDAKNIVALSKIVSRFPGKEIRAAEAATLLFERGIEGTFESVARLIRAIEGNLEDGDRDFLAFVNHKKGQKNHWIIVPFKQLIGDHMCSGSIRFLLDTETMKFLEARITIFENSRCWDFILDRDTCSLTASQLFKPVQQEKFVVYLKSVLQKFGIFDVFWYSSDNDDSSVIQSVDMEV